MKPYSTNPNAYRVIKTERDIDKINDHAKNGFLPVCVRIEPLIKCCPRFMLLQDLQTKEFVVIKDNEPLPSIPDFNERYKVVINWREFYPIKFTIPFAAYLAPPDLAIGEQVFLEDVITDHIGMDWDAGVVQRVKSCEAIWNGKEFLVKYRPDLYGAMLMG